MEKVALSRRARSDWLAGALPIGHAQAPERPARPARPELLAPNAMPRRRAGGGLRGRITLLHALAHIELNAIDLAWDILVRFEAEPAFIEDWSRVAAEEAEHYSLLHDRLIALGAAYGDLPAHDGLWQAAQDTADDLMARLAIVPLVLEARGLDVTPVMIERLEAAGDGESAAILRRIYEDEIGHVAIGRHWFGVVGAERGIDPVESWRALVAERFRGQLKPPFNAPAREQAGFPPEFWALSEDA